MFTQTQSKNLLLKEVSHFLDERGVFSPTISSHKISEAGGNWKNLNIEQTNIIHNTINVLRGLHLQK